MGWEGGTGRQLIRIVCIYYHSPADAQVEFLHMESGNKIVEPVQIVKAMKDRGEEEGRPLPVRISNLTTPNSQFIDSGIVFLEMQSDKVLPLPKFVPV